MKVFCTIHHLNSWHYITVQNIHKYLSSYPYIQDGNYFAVCSYCHNPIKIIQRAKSNSADLILYGTHTNDIVPGFSNFDRDKLDHCLLKEHISNMVLNPLATPTLKISRINTAVLRKDLTYYTGVYFSNKLTHEILQEHDNVFAYRHADYYNLPLTLLLATEHLKLNYRKIANPRFISAIKRESKLFDVSETNQIIPIDDAATLEMHFEKPTISKSGFPSLYVSISESQDDYSHQIYGFHIFAKMFNNLLIFERNDT